MIFFVICLLQLEPDLCLEREHARNMCEKIKQKAILAVSSSRLFHLRGDRLILRLHLPRLQVRIVHAAKHILPHQPAGLIFVNIPLRRNMPEAVIQIGHRAKIVVITAGAG